MRDAVTKRLPPPAPTDDLVQPGAEEVERAVDGDAKVRIRHRSTTVFQGPVGLGLAVGLDVTPLQGFCDLLADAIEAQEADIARREAAVAKREKALAAKGRKKLSGKRKPKG